MVIIYIAYSVVILSVITGSVKAACPNIIKKSEWGARTAFPGPLTVDPPTHVIIHHGNTTSCTTKASCISRVKNIQSQHIDSNGWIDIGYNFLVGEDGNVYEGRGWGKTGAHAPGHNSNSIGICFIGDFSSKLPNAAALQAGKDLIACGVSQGKIKEDYRLVGHQQIKATSCPGSKLFEEIKTWPKWTSTP